MRLSTAVFFGLLMGCGLTLDFDPPEDSVDGGRWDGGQDAAADGDRRDAGQDASEDADVDPEDGGLDVGPPGCGTDEDCGELGFCADGVCVMGACGNGEVEAFALEECDDGNLEDGDGCDSDCKWTCDIDPGTARPCGPRRGCVAEHCVDHRCVPENTDGLSCAVSGVPATCEDGVCGNCGNGAHDPGEECDSSVPGSRDGCGPDCRFGCASNLDCDACDRCVSGGCVTNTLPFGVCDVCFGGSYVRRDEDGDGSGACDAFGCEEFSGCDCNDADPLVFGDDEGLHGCGTPGGFVDCGPDDDGDGFAPRERASAYEGTCPDPLIEVTRYDCYDENSEANPEATRPRTTDRGDGSFDWNCDGRDTPTHLIRAEEECRASGAACSGSGWVRRTPTCGVRGLWQECTMSEDGCRGLRYFRAQSCI